MGSYHLLGALIKELESIRYRQVGEGEEFQVEGTTPCTQKSRLQKRLGKIDRLGKRSFNIVNWKKDASAKQGIGKRSGCYTGALIVIRTVV